jgi:diamine N-acetyltransferase
LNEVQMDKGTAKSSKLSLLPVDKDNWRDVAHIKVEPAQREFVMEPSYYLALCSYGGDWQPLAIYLGERVIGFMMWAVDPADGSCWLGGIMIDVEMQGKGYGKRAIRSAIQMLSGEHGFTDFALSYQGQNHNAQGLYAKLGFMETGEMEGDEIVARYVIRENG